MAGNPEGKIRHERYNRIFEDDINMTQIKYQWRALVNTVMDLFVP
jgi:hypothetical protein